MVAERRCAKACILYSAKYMAGARTSGKCVRSPHTFLSGRDLLYVNLVSLRAFTVATALTTIVAGTPTAQSGLPAVASPPSLARESDASFGGTSP